MKVYDFDGVIYRGNTTREFYIFALKRHRAILRCLPGQIWAFLRYCFGTISQIRFWSLFYSYFRYIPHLEEEAEAFWESRKSRFSPTYLAVRGNEDLVLSSLPEMLLKPICNWLGLRYLGFRPERVKGEEEEHAFQSTDKLARFQKEFPEERMERFWAAHYSDRKLVLEAEEGRIVRGNDVLDWDEFVRREPRWRKWLRTWLSPEFFRFWCVGWFNLVAAWILEVIWSELLPPNIGFSVGYFMSLLVSFTLNSKITFKMPMSFYRLFRFVLSYIPNFLVQTLTVLLFYNLLHFPHSVTYFLAAAIGTPVTFICLKWFAFRT